MCPSSSSRGREAWERRPSRPPPRRGWRCAGRRCWRSPPIRRIRWATRWACGSARVPGKSPRACSPRRWMRTRRCGGGPARARRRSASSPRAAPISTRRTSTSSSRSRFPGSTSSSAWSSCRGWPAPAATAAWWWTPLPPATRCGSWPCPTPSRGSRACSTTCRESTAGCPGRCAAGTSRMRAMRSSKASRARRRSCAS